MGENVLITSLQQGDHAKLADFGMAKRIHWADDRTPDHLITMKCGKVVFLRGEASSDEEEEDDTENRNMDWYAKRDWYGLGCCLMLMLLGERAGRKLRHDKRVVLLPAAQTEINKVVHEAWSDDTISDDVYDIVSSLLQPKARDRGNSIDLRNSQLL